MLQKLNALDLRFASIEAQLGAGETYNDPALVAKLNKEQRELEPVVTAFRAYTRCQQDLKDAEELMGDPELGEMAREEYQQAKGALARLEDEIRILLLPRDPNDDKNVIVEIRAGAVCPLPFPYVLHVRRRPALEGGGGLGQRDRAWRR